MTHFSSSHLFSSKRLARLAALGVALSVPAFVVGCGGSSGGKDDDEDEVDNDDEPEDDTEQDDTGGSGGRGGRGGNGGAGGGGAGGDGGTGGSVPPPPGVDACGPLPAAPIRRLARHEYVGTIRELFAFAFTPDADGVYRMDNHMVTFQRGTQEVRWGWKDDVPTGPDTFGFLNRASNLNPTTFILEAYGDNAAVLAEYVTQAKFLPMLLPCTDKTVDCGKKFIDSYGPKFFRRPMADDEKKAYGDFFQAQFDGAKTDNAQVDAFMVALRLTIEVFLQSPQFLYRIELGDPATKKEGAIKLTPYETASRLSYTLWSTMPDQVLFDAAAANKLSTPAELEEQARRMMKDKRFKFMVIEYFRQWADLERIFSEGYRKKPGYSLGDTRHPFPIWYALAARREVEMLAEAVLADGDGTINTLLTTTKGWKNRYLDALYSGVRVPDTMETPDFTYAAGPDVPAAQRAGLITRAFFGWTYSHFDTPNPPVRGSFMLSKLFCERFGAPPADAQTRAGAAKFTAGMTNRQQFEARMAVADSEPGKMDGVCRGCHNVLDPIGFSMEIYNEVGMFLAKDAKNPGANVDASGKVELPNPTDIDGPFTNAVDLSKKMGKSKSVQACLVQQWYEYVTGRDAKGIIAPGEDEGEDQCRIKSMNDAVTAKNGDVREGLITWIKSADFLWRPAY